MRNLYYSIISISFLLFSSCSFFLLPEFKVENVEVDYDNNCINLTFSDIPDKNHFIDNFSLSEDGTECSGHFLFNDKIVSFYPENGLREYYDYILSLPTDVENTHGISLNDEFEYKFTTKTEWESPRILSVTPANECYIDDPIKSIDFLFSEAIDKDSFEDSITISPSIDYNISWISESNASLILTEEPDYNTMYKISINTGLSDLQHNKLINSFYSTFNYKINFDELSYDVKYEYDTKEVLLSPDKIYTADEFNAYSKGSFVIDFNNEVSVDSLSSYISFYPDIDFTITPNRETKKSITITLDEKPDWNKNYVLKIKNGITDLYDHTFDSCKTYYIPFSDTRDEPVSFVKGYIQLAESATSSEKWFSFSEESIYSDIDIDPTNPSGSEQSEYTSQSIVCYYVFKISPDAETLKTEQVLDGISIQTTNSCISFIIDKCNIIKAENFSKTESAYDSIVSDEYKESPYIIVKQQVTMQNSSSIGFIKFQFSADIEDSLGNTIGETLILPFNKI